MHLNTCWQEHLASSQQRVLVLLAILLGQFAKFRTKGPTSGNEWGETIRLLSPFPPRQAYSPWSILPANSFRCLLHSYPAISLRHNEFDSEKRLPYCISCCYTPHNFAFVFFPFTSVFKKSSALHFWSVKQEQCIKEFLPSALHWWSCRTVGAGGVTTPERGVHQRQVRVRNCHGASTAHYLHRAFFTSAFPPAGDAQLSWPGLPFCPC